MRYFAGSDVSIKETSIYIVDDEGRILREAKVLTEPAAIVAELTRCGIIYGRVGLEAGPPLT
jgi:transposase